MSINALAEHLKSKGRGQDTMLVHMSPREVGGLQSLAMAHGGSLTKNPETGLPEANFLESILPAVIGLGITAATGGAAAPWMVGAGVGAGTTLATGSLEKGLLAGLGAYGGAGLGSSLAAAGAGASTGATGAALSEAASAGMANPALVEAGTTGLQGAAMEAGALSAGNAGTTLSNMGAGLSQAASAPGAFLSNNAMNLGMAAAPALGTPEQPAPQENDDYIQPYDYSQTVNPNFGMPGQPYYNQTFTPQAPVLASDFSGFADGGIAEIPQRYTQPVQPVNQAVTDYNQKLMQQANYEYNQMPQLGAFQSAIPGAGAFNQQAADAYKARQEEMAKALEANQPTKFGYQYDPVSGMAVKKFDPMGDQVTSPLSQQVASLQSQLSELQGMDNWNPYDQFANQNAAGGLIGMADGGIASLGGYSDGGQLLRGPGDGVSDDIPASIEGRQPARLAEGEFVIPARIVSEIGNGSTDAGAKRLYNMMDRIQSRRQKSMKDIAADTKAYQELPK